MPYIKTLPSGQPVSLMLMLGWSGKLAAVRGNRALSDRERKGAGLLRANRRAHNLEANFSRSTAGLQKI